MRSPKAGLSLLLTAVAVLLTACSATGPFQTVQHDTSKGGGFSKVLVIALAANETYERYAEEQFVTRLQRQGVNAKAWVDFPGGNRRVSEKSVLKAIENTDIEGVVVTRVSSIRTMDRVEPGQVDIGWSIGNIADSPADWSRDQNVTIDVLVTLFDSEAGLVWRGKSSTENPRSTEYLIDKSAEAAVSELSKLSLVR